jgi:hypothetical protein
MAAIKAHAGGGNANAPIRQAYGRVSQTDHDLFNGNSIGAIANRLK